MTEANLQADSLEERPAQRAAGHHEMKEDDSSPHDSPMWSPILRPPTGHPSMNYCLLIKAILTDKLGDVLPPPHAWTVLVVEDMLRDIRPGLTEAIVIGPGKAILFYGRHYMGEGLMVDEARDAAILITSDGTWVVKPAYLTADPTMLPEGKRAITHALSDQRVKARGPGHPRVNLPAQQPFRFNTSRTPPPGDPPTQVEPEGSTPQRPFRDRGHHRRRREQTSRMPRIPSLSPDRGFESNQSSMSVASLMSSQSDCSDRSGHSRHGRRHREETCMKINLPIFKDEDAKDVVTYQSWQWDLMVYRRAGCRDCTLLPYTIRSLQGYPGELV